MENKLTIDPKFAAAHYEHDLHPVRESYGRFNSGLADYLMRQHPDLLDMALKLAAYCIRHNIPRISLINGVAWDGEGYAEYRGADKPIVEFTDAWNCKHTLSINAAARELKEFYDEWPGGLEEIESALKTAYKKRAVEKENNND